ncbi:MAG: 3-deoxy-manno-octulosonate cytidylyltransferase [Gammaproteobacteria bacterium]|nr:3-deoxy-manno-octulosonate cytidylyltransferase [Gammaproteobacteria bacterium]|tara:strand:+ start:4129 stop:4866 length:738 start_codon:yes stop_codon:yes gene_type:complete
MSFIVLIPARLKSTRLPSKPLLDIGGKSLIQRVFENSSFSDAEGVFVATDHESIVENCNSFGAESILTNVNHHSGTDRLSEAASILGLKKETIIVNVQGDEPFVDPADINQLGYLFENYQNIEMGTLYTKLKKEEEDNPNVVKIWVDINKQVKGFSRKKDFLKNKNLIRLKHLGLYSFRVSFLEEFVSLKRTSSELNERLEQLRALENGKLILALASKLNSYLGIDTPADLKLARTRILDDKNKK